MNDHILITAVLPPKCYMAWATFQDRLDNQIVLWFWCHSYLMWRLSQSRKLSWCSIILSHVSEFGSWSRMWSECNGCTAYDLYRLMCSISCQRLLTNRAQMLLQARLAAQHRDMSTQLLRDWPRLLRQSWWHRLHENIKLDDFLLKFCK